MPHIKTILIIVGTVWVLNAIGWANPIAKFTSSSSSGG